jgi:type II secretory pathway pseudopilin PulG
MQRGFTYVGLLLAVALVGVLLAGLGTLWSMESRRAKEDELLFIGEQFHTAITAYFENTPTGQRSRFPPQLADLLDDKRWPVRRRHLRDIYPDPLTGTRDWVIIKAPDGGVLGVYSPAAGTPLRRAHFTKAFKSFEEAGSYADWRFAYALPDPAIGPDGKPIDPNAPRPPTLSNAPNASEVLENGPQAQPLPVLP